MQQSTGKGPLARAKTPLDLRHQKWKKVAEAISKMPGEHLSQIAGGTRLPVWSKSMESRQRSHCHQFSQRQQLTRSHVQ